MRRLLQSLWTYVGLGLLVFYILLYLYLDLPSSLADTASVDPMRTLLGALATGLITAQALVFTISLVAAQLNARYTHRMVSRVFTWPTALYMGLFIFSSVYSAVVLALLSSRATDFTLHVPALKPIHPVTIALALAGTCLALLVPYLWSFRRRLDPEQMAEDEGRRALAMVRRGATAEPREVAALDNIAMSAYGYKDYDTLAKATEELARVGLEAWRLSRSTIARCASTRTPGTETFGSAVTQNGRDWWLPPAGAGTPSSSPRSWAGWRQTLSKGSRTPIASGLPGAPWPR